MFDTLINCVKEYACQSPDKVAIAIKTERITYSQLYKDIERIAGRLLELGITKGDMVPFSAVSKPEMISVYLGIHYIGAVAVFVDKIASPDTVAFRIDIIKDDGTITLLQDFGDNNEITFSKDLIISNDDNKCHLVITIRSLLEDEEELLFIYEEECENSIY